MLKHFVIFGPPGSGKGTQAKRLVKRFGLEYIGTGDLMRQEANSDTPLGKKIKEILEGVGGKLLDDQTANEMVDDVLRDIEPDQSIIFDGYPRTMNQVEYLEGFIETNKIKLYVVNLKVDDANIIKRTTTRRICENCKRIFQDPEQLKISKCLECGGKLIARTDDKVEVVKNRLKIYNEQTKPLLSYYRQNKELVEIDGNPPQDEVFDEIESKVENILSRND